MQVSFTWVCSYCSLYLAPATHMLCCFFLLCQKHEKCKVRKSTCMIKRLLSCHLDELFGYYPVHNAQLCSFIVSSSEEQRPPVSDETLLSLLSLETVSQSPRQSHKQGLLFHNQKHKINIQNQIRK